MKPKKKQSDDWDWFEDDQELRLLQNGKRGILSAVFGRSTIIALLVLAEFAIIILTAHWLGEYSPAFYLVSRLLSVGVIFYLINTSGNPTQKITWIVLIFAVPALGLTLYVLVRLDIGHRAIKNRLQTVIAETAPLSPLDLELMETLRTDAPEMRGLAAYAYRTASGNVYANTAVRYLPSGEAKFEALIEALEQAEHFIFMEYFIIDEGTMWGRVLKILEEKVRAGVEVRVLYDGMCAFTRLPYRYPRELEELGIRCKMFAPMRPFASTYYNNRDHRKIVVIDGRVGFTGGVNLADEYININSRFGHWKDAALRLEGEAVRSFTLLFLQMWAIDEREPDDFARYLDASVPCAAPDPGYVLPYADSPLDEERVGETVYLNILDRANHYVHIFTPYLILDDQMITALTNAAKRGVDVQIILPHVPDKKYAFALAKGHYRELLRAGVRIFEYTPGFVHAKVFVSDDSKAVVGTINLDYRSLYLHFENAVYLWGVPAIADAEADFAATRERCQEITHDDWKTNPLMTRIVATLLRLFAPLL